MTGSPADDFIATDREVVASALVLRDVHCGLLRAVEGAPLTPDATPPAAAPLISLPEATASQGQWSNRLVDAVLSATEPVGQDAWVSFFHPVCTPGDFLFPCKFSSLSVCNRASWTGCLGELLSSCLYLG